MIKQYNVCLATMYVLLQCMSCYNVCLATMYVLLHFSTRSQETRKKWRVTTYKIFHYRKGLLITVSKNSSGILTHHFNLAKPGLVSVSSARECYSGPLPLKPVKLVDHKKM